MNGWPITNYQIWQIKKWIRAIIVSAAGILVLGNIIAAVFINKVHVDPKSYTLKEGFPIFHSSDDYLNLVQRYHHDIGAKVIIYTIRRGESFWDVARRYSISIDTIIAANPFLTSLLAHEGLQIVVPTSDGVLLPVDNFYDAYRMARLLQYDDAITGDYRQSVFRILAPDDIRFAFFKDTRPAIVSDRLQSLYNIRKIFQNPLRYGMYSSLYGDRVDPMREGMAFHNGVDIQVRMGTPIYPAREGMVSYTGWLDGYGQTVIVQHPDGYVTTYGHCSSIKVRTGEMVGKKTVIALVGSTGRSTGPHLHFMTMRHGRMINPLLFIW